MYMGCPGWLTVPLAGSQCSWDQKLSGKQMKQKEEDVKLLEELWLKVTGKRERLFSSEVCQGQSKHKLSKPNS